MEFGCFSISLNVKDIKISKEFYEKIGFKIYHGEESQGWLIMKNGICNIGLFQGMIDKNTLTFNPGWDQNAGKLDSFSDIREIQNNLKASGIQFVKEADETKSGPDNFIILDPDGNPILLDQHV